MTINHHGAEVGDLNVKLLYEQQKNERQTVVNEQQSRQIHDMEKQVKVHNHISSSSFHVSNCRRCMRSVGLDVLNGSVKRGAESIPMPWMVGLRRTLLKRQRHVSSKPLRSKLATLTYFLSITSCPRVRFPSATLSANLFRKHLPHHMSPPCALAKLFWVPVNRPEYAPNQTIPQVKPAMDYNTSGVYCSLGWFNPGYSPVGVYSGLLYRHQWWTSGMCRSALGAGHILV